jgi:hypothetical protein
VVRATNGLVLVYDQPAHRYLGTNDIVQNGFDQLPIAELEVRVSSLGWLCRVILKFGDAFALFGYLPSGKGVSRKSPTDAQHHLYPTWSIKRERNQSSMKIAALSAAPVTPVTPEISFLYKTRSGCLSWEVVPGSQGGVNGVAVMETALEGSRISMVPWLLPKDFKMIQQNFDDEGKIHYYYTVEVENPGKAVDALNFILRNVAVNFQPSWKVTIHFNAGKVNPDSVYIAKFGGFADLGIKALDTFSSTGPNTKRIMEILKKTYPACSGVV